MGAWAAYLTAAGLMLSVAAALAEGGLRQLGRPVRWVWLWAMVATVVLGGVALALGLRGGTVPSAPGQLALVGWAAVSLGLLTNLRISGWTLRRNARSWRRERVDGHPVLVSAGFGPGVVGAARPRIVLPAWMLESPPSVRCLILRHELEHVRAGDARLLVAGLVLVSLVPWSLPLWWQLHGLGAAIETDCDARVMAATSSRRAYAELLVAVAGRRTRRLRLVPPLAPATAELERRILLITARRTDRSMRRGLAALAMALAVAVAVAGLPLPRPVLPDIAPAPAVSEAPAEAFILFSM